MSRPGPVALRDLLPGATLPNGATLLAAAPARTGGVWVVFAYRAEGVHPWVTWACPQSDAARTYGGHYFADPTRAAVEFARRALGRNAVSSLV